MTKYTKTHARTRYPSNSRRTPPIDSIPSLICKTWLLKRTVRDILVYRYKYLPVNIHCWHICRFWVICLLPILFNRRWCFVLHNTAHKCSWFFKRDVVQFSMFCIIAIILCPCSICKETKKNFFFTKISLRNFKFVMDFLTN